MIHRKAGMSFTLPTFTTVLVKSVNIRAEVHGKEKVPAADIGFLLTCSNSVLSMFDAGLLVGLYKPTEGDDDQPDLDGVEPLSERPLLRCPSIAMPIDLNREYVGRNVVIDYGLGGSSNIELTTCTVGAFKVDAKEGGTVEIHFRVQVSSIDQAALGALGCLVKHEVQITLLSSPQADNTQEQLTGTAPKVHSAQGALIVDPAADGKPADPTGAFLDAHGEKPMSEEPSTGNADALATAAIGRAKTKGRGPK
jgi:hypothetical protein